MCVFGGGEMKTVGDTFVSGKYNNITSPPTLEEKRRVPSSLKICDVIRPLRRFQLKNEFFYILSAFKELQKLNFNIFFT